MSGWEFIHSFEGRRDYWHAMNSDVGTEACAASETFSECCSNTSLSWKSFDSNEIRSLLECLQLISDRSEISLSAGSLQLFALHVPILNFFKEQRRMLASNGKTVIAYQLLKFESKNTTPIQKSAVADGFSYVTKVKKLNALYDCNANYLEPLSIAV